MPQKREDLKAPVKSFRKIHSTFAQRFLLQILRDVRENRSEYVVMRYGQPACKIVPISVTDNFDFFTEIPRKQHIAKTLPIAEKGSNNETEVKKSNFKDEFPELSDEDFDRSFYSEE